MGDLRELAALRNVLVEAHAIISEADQPAGCNRRTAELLNSAIALVVNLLSTTPAVAHRKRANQNTLKNVAGP
jgi:hypothetical protein